MFKMAAIFKMAAENNVYCLFLGSMTNKTHSKLLYQKKTIPQIMLKEKIKMTTIFKKAALYLDISSNFLVNRFKTLQVTLKLTENLETN